MTHFSQRRRLAAKQLAHVRVRGQVRADHLDRVLVARMDVGGAVDLTHTAGAEFSDDTDFVNINGEHHRGDRSVIAAGHDGIFASIYAGSTVTYHVDVARTLVPGVIAAVATSTLDAPAGPLLGTNRSRITAVLVDEGDRWAIQAFQNTLVRG